MDDAFTLNKKDFVLIPELQKKIMAPDELHRLIEM